MSRLSGMEAFIAVTETGSFSAAGKRLGIARAVVSKRVSALESTMGARLLNRTTRRVSITGPGTEFYERCRVIIEEFYVARDELAKNQIEPEGHIKLSVPMSFGQLHLAPALLDFMEFYPKIVVNMILTDRFVDVIAEGYDLVVRVGNLEDSSLISRHLAPVKRILCASPNYLELMGSPDKPEDLTHHRILHYGWHQTGTRWDLQGKNDKKSIEVEVNFSANNGEVLAAAAKAGRGVALIPNFVIADELKEGKLVRVLPDYEATSIGLHALWPASKLQPTRVRILIDFLINRFSGRAYWDQD
ncbi:LysR family transcriptional regulator [Kiloniella majae]|uniref:LysR family transcriptional regulator n=1 Tax=Kiloniella majae TaxID=1938558 RepID=UPI0015C51F7B|nr:LysR family transcriptional regulator [Kiloniella majae]